MRLARGRTELEAKSVKLTDLTLQAAADLLAPEPDGAGELTARHETELRLGCRGHRQGAQAACRSRCRLPHGHNGQDRGPTDSVDKRTLSERDICTKFITLALRRAGWDVMSQIREEVSFTKGRIIVRGKLVTRGRAKRASG
jgi:hypothetical protein